MWNRHGFINMNGMPVGIPVGMPLGVQIVGPGPYGGGMMMAGGGIPLNVFLQMHGFHQNHDPYEDRADEERREREAAERRQAEQERADREAQEREAAERRRAEQELAERREAERRAERQRKIQQDTAKAERLEREARERQKARQDRVRAKLAKVSTPQREGVSEQPDNPTNSNEGSIVHCGMFSQQNQEVARDDSQLQMSSAPAPRRS